MSVRKFQILKFYGLDSIKDSWEDSNEIKNVFDVSVLYR